MPNPNKAALEGIEVGIVQSAEDFPLPKLPSKYPFEAMVNVGDTFHIRCADNQHENVRNSVVTGARKHAIKLVHKSDPTGIRFWRVK